MSSSDTATHDASPPELHAVATVNTITKAQTTTTAGAAAERLQRGNTHSDSDTDRSNRRAARASISSPGPEVLKFRGRSSDDTRTSATNWLPHTRHLTTRMPSYGASRRSTGTCSTAHADWIALLQ
jgi:hypothetical protein